jgi:hypothetical protein
MAKYLTNNSARVISIGSKNLVPGTGPVEVSAKDLAHPLIAAKIQKGILTVTEDAAPEKEKPALPTKDEPVPDPLAAAGKNVAKLKAYAAKAKVDIGEAKTADEIIAAIKAAEANAAPGV